jgi:hypothetical protein
MKKSFRPVNQVLGSEPTIGPFAVWQIFPMLAVGMLCAYLAIATPFPWWLALIIWTILSIVYLVVMGDKPWLTLSRLYKPPNVIRVGLDFHFDPTSTSFRKAKSKSSHQSSRLRLPQKSSRRRRF